MNRQGVAMMSDNLAEIWPGFQMSNNANVNATSSYCLPLDPTVNRSKRRHDTSTSNDDATNVTSESDSKRHKAGGSNENCESKEEEERNSGNAAEQQSAKPAELPKQDYIHVRARRGQATDSHSLAERARREKISERMRTLQDLVPGCNKVIGKALVLDEIINYVQSLQRQVEFLSMKLEAVNARDLDAYASKDASALKIPQLPELFGQQSFEAPGMAFGSQSTREYGRGSSPEWLHMQIGGGFERT